MSNIDNYESDEYKEVLDIYKLFLEELKNNNNDLNKTLNDFNIENFECHHINNIDYIKKNIMIFFINENYNNEQLKKILLNILDADKVEKIFNIFREYSFDLWTTIDNIFYEVFSTNIISPHDLNIAKLKNPPYSEDLYLGIKCALLKYFNIIEDDNCFTNFNPL